MRFYEGRVYSLARAVYPKNSNFSYRILDIPSRKQGYIHYGYDRYYEVGEKFRIFLRHKNDKGLWKEKHIKIPFVRNRERNRLEFDLLAYLKSLGISYKLYKSCDFYGGCGTESCCRSRWAAEISGDPRFHDIYILTVKATTT